MDTYIWKHANIILIEINNIKREMFKNICSLKIG
jgi:hypothetical protein